MIQLRKAELSEYEKVREFYRTCVAYYEDQPITGYKKGCYPDHDDIRLNTERGEQYVLDGENGYDACIVANTYIGDGHEDVKWLVNCEPDEVMALHSLMVRPDLQGKGVGRAVMQGMIEIAKEQGKKSIRLDILKSNPITRTLYKSIGYREVQDKVLYFTDTGWADYTMMEYVV